MRDFMIDYSEGYLALKKHLDDMWKATLTQDWQTAMTCCLSIQSLATLTSMKMYEEMLRQRSREAK
jgi:hypothetical protein